jgi:hypothetical protein
MTENPKPSYPEDAWRLVTVVRELTATEVAERNTSNAHI